MRACCVGVPPIMGAGLHDEDNRGRKKMMASYSNRLLAMTEMPTTVQVLKFTAKRRCGHAGGAGVSSSPSNAGGGVTPTPPTMSKGRGRTASPQQQQQQQQQQTQRDSPTRESPPTMNGDRKTGEGTEVVPSRPRPKVSTGFSSGLKSSTAKDDPSTPPTTGGFSLPFVKRPLSSKRVDEGSPNRIGPGGGAPLFQPYDHL